VMVKPEIDTVFPEPMWNTRLFALPSTARFAVPGPEIVTLLSTSNSPLVSPIVPVTVKVIVSPSFASASAWRSEPGSVSFVFVTVIVVACRQIGVMQSSNRQMRAYCPKNGDREVDFLFIC
jgi:hypothetical protein